MSIKMRIIDAIPTGQPITKIIDALDEVRRDMEKLLPIPPDPAPEPGPDPNAIYRNAAHFKQASLAYAAHRSTCRAGGGGCDDDEDCEAGAALWRKELDAQLALFNALDGGSLSRLSDDFGDPRSLAARVSFLEKDHLKALSLLGEMMATMTLPANQLSFQLMPDRWHETVEVWRSRFLDLQPAG